MISKIIHTIKKSIQFAKIVHKVMKIQGEIIKEILEKNNAKIIIKELT